MTMRRTIFLLLAVSALVLHAQPAGNAAAAQRCFSETQQCIDGRIAEFWEQNGGLMVFGLPIGPQESTVIDGVSYTSQRFERTRLELHPELGRPYDVLLGRMGVQRLEQQGRNWFALPKQPAASDCRVFSQTGHAVCGQILAKWRANGLQIDGKQSVSEAESLALFGLPISGLMTETLSDGKQYQVQWFERARFELHPENAAPYNVLLGLLGRESVQALPQPVVAPVVTPVATATPQPLSRQQLRERIGAMPAGYWTTEFENITFAVGGFTYYKELYEIFPSAGKRFVRCSVSLFNKRSNINDTVYIDTERLTLVDADNRIYSVAIKPTKALRNGLIPSNAYPGRLIGGEVVFEIPTSTSPAKMLYRYDVNKPTVEVFFDTQPFR